MPILDSLLTAIMRADGDALVLHVGERPYVVTRIGNVDLAKTVLTLDAVSSMLAQLLPADLLETLAEVGAVEHQLQPPSAMRDAFTVVAARGGDDIWIEIRRKRAVVMVTPDLPKVIEEPKAPEAATAPEGPATPEVVAVLEAAVIEAAVATEAVVAPEVPESSEAPPPSTIPAVTEVAAATDEPTTREMAAAGEVVEMATPPSAPDMPDVAHAVTPLETSSVVDVAMAPEVPAPADAAPETVSEADPLPSASEVVVPIEPTMTVAEALEESEPVSAVPAVTDLSTVTDLSETEDSPAVSEVPNDSDRFDSPIVPDAPGHNEIVARADASQHDQAPHASQAEPEPQRPVEAANVVPLTRVIRVEVPHRAMPTKENSVERLLNLAVVRSGEQVYLTSQSRPFLRTEGEMRAVETEPTYSAADIEAIVQQLMPESAREQHARGESAEWTSDFEGVGPIRCATFRDHRGPGVVFHLATTRPVAAEQLGLTRDMQALATETEGLVIIAGPRAGGKSTLAGAMIDLINRQHSVSVITIEREIRIVHENRLALVSQREVSGTSADAVAAVRTALRETPDVLLIDEPKSAEVVHLALDAAGGGRLVILTISAGSTVSAVSRVLDAFAPAARKAAQLALAERLRGAISQVVLRKTGGGRIAARELLLSSATVASLIADGQLSQLGPAISSGRKHGMVLLNDVLATLVKNGSVDAGEAYRKADNREALLAMLEHNGVDTSLLARLA